MKCAYCAKTLMNSDIVYKLATEELYDAQVGSIPDSETDAGNSFDMMNGMGELSTMGDFPSAASEYVSGNTLEQEHDAVPIYEKIKVSRKHEEMENSEKSLTCSGDLCLGYEVKNITVNGISYAHAELKKRRCRFCKKPLPRLSGKMPTFLVMMAGHSTAGKTTFLLGQRIMFGEKEFKIIEGVVYPEIQGNTEDKICHFEDEHENDFIEDAYRTYLEKGFLPGTTTDTPIPHCVKFSYRRNGNDVNGNKILTYQSECLVIFQDVMGELATQSHVEERRKMIEKAGLADAYLIAMDSSVLMGEIPGVSKVTAPPRILQSAMDKTFSEYEGRVVKPSVVILTKTDEILKHKHDLNLSGVDETTPVLNAGMNFNGEAPTWKSLFLDKMNEGTIDLLEKLQQGGGGSWHGMLEKHFPSAKYISVTVYGDHAEVDKDEKKNKIIRNAEPRHTEAPILYLLMELGMLPPMQKPKFAEDYEKEYETWYDECCQNPILPNQRLFKQVSKRPWWAFWKRKKQK